MIAGMVPVNLVHAISIVGFDYDMSTRDIIDGVVAGHLVLWERQWEIGADGRVADGGDAPSQTAGR
jgi:hypothetical protein